MALAANASAIPLPDLTQEADYVETASAGCQVGHEP
jgi:hypothetical protein